MARSTFEAMGAALSDFGPDGGGRWHGGAVALGQRILVTTDDAAPDFLPCGFPECTVAAIGRLDNRDDLIREFGLGSRVGDGRIIAEAYRRWGASAPGHLFGDWAFAAWDHRTRRLLVARDHLGITALYYHFDGKRLTFGSSRKALFVWPHVARRLNELRLAQHLAFWVTASAATLHEGIFRLPPGHMLSVGEGGLHVTPYWDPAGLQQARMASDDDYVERFLELYAAAVSTRMRGTGPVATTLSSGLDSGSVAALAAVEARRRNQHLMAFTARPRFATADSAAVPYLADEWPLAQRTAAHCGVADHHPIDAAGITPLQAMRASLRIHDEPEYAVANIDWIHAILAASRDRHARVLLTGQLGNGGVSWSGDRHAVVRPLLSGDITGAVRALRAARAGADLSTVGAVWRHIVAPLGRAAFGTIARHGPQAGRSGLINPRFARRLRIDQRMRKSGYDARSSAILSPLEQRFRYFRPGANPLGALWHENGAAYGLDVRDPTADIRLLEFCLAIPSRQFRRDGQDRWLMRRAMASRLPADILCSRRPGRQAADFAARLHADGARMAAVIDALSCDDAVREYLNVPVMLERWRRIRDDRPSLSTFSRQETLAFGRTVQIGLFLAGGV